jgi:20S proteasome subunit alpha 5
VALLVAGCDDKGPVLFHTDPSGTYVAYQARAIGSGSEGAQSLLQSKYSADMTLKDAEALAMSVLKQVRVKILLDCCIASCAEAALSGMTIIRP